jgi:hypothetical protein
MSGILLDRNRLEFLLLVHSFEESNSLDFLSGDETRRRLGILLKMLEPVRKERNFG